MIPLRFSGFTIFQPTRPLRGATGGQGGILSLSPYFNPRAPCGARRNPRHGCQAVLKDFNPRAPCGARRSPVTGQRRWKNDFNPRAPCGARLPSRTIQSSALLFQPTRPLRGATQVEPRAARVGDISTHAPLAGRDSKSVQITMHIFAITDKFQMLLHRMPPVRAFCSFLMQENHADFGCEPPK